MNGVLSGVLITVGVMVILIILLSLLKWYMQGGKYRKQNRIDKKIVIVTGANSGIGKETVRELARRGATVYMACRNMKRCEEASKEIIRETGNQNVYCRELDLASLESVRSFAENFKKEQDRLDILINNAGVMMCPLMHTKEGIEMQLGVNHIGHFLLTNLLLDVLKESKPSRIIIVSSKIYDQGKIDVNDLNSEKSYDRLAAYTQSKLANILFTKELSKHLTGTGVTVNSLHPGVVDTDLTRHIPTLNNCLGRFFIRPLLWPFFKTPKSGAQTTLYAALDPNLELVSGAYFSDCKAKRVADQANDDVMARWLWTESENWTKLKKN